MEQNEITALFSTLSGAAISIFASYLPGFSGWFDKLRPAQKQLLLLVVIAVLIGGAYGLSFTGKVNLFTPDLDGALWALGNFVLCLIANQSVYKSTNYIVDESR